MVQSVVINSGGISTTGILYCDKMQSNSITTSTIFNISSLSTVGSVNIGSNSANTSDIILSTTTAGSARNIRLQSDSSYSLTGINSVQIGPVDNPSLSVGDTFCNVSNKLFVGPVIVNNVQPSERLYVYGDVKVSGTLKIGSDTALTTSYNPIFCGGFVSSNGAKGTTIGRVDYTVTYQATGRYLITYATAYPSNNYMPTVTCYIPSGASASYGNAGPLTNSTRLEIHTITVNSLANCNFYFMVY